MEENHTPNTDIPEQTVLYQLISLTIGQDLREWVAVQRSEEPAPGWRVVAERLRASGADVSFATLARWFRDMEE